MSAYKSSPVSSSAITSAPDASPLMAAKSESTAIPMPFPKPMKTKPQKKKNICRWVCGLLLMIIIILGVIIGLYFPRVGGIKSSKQPYLKEGVSTIKTNGNMYNASVTNPYTVTILAFLDVNVTMNNAVDINLDKVAVSGAYIDDPNFTYDGALSGIVLKKQATTTLVIPISFTYKLTKPVSLVDAVQVTSLLTACSSNSDLTVSRSISIYVPVISLFYVHTVKSTEMVTCGFLSNQNGIPSLPSLI